MKKITDWSAPKDASGNRLQIPNPQYSPILQAALVDVKEFLTNVDDSVLREMFGDHVEIKVSREGTEVEEYSHD